MAATKQEYLVGWISPTNRPDGRETQLDDKMPSNIRVANVTTNFTRGTEEEFRASMPVYEAKVRELAAMNADLILPSGAPPFMLLGFEGERQIIQSWEKQFGIPMFTSGQNHVRALRTLGVRQFVGASYFPEKMNSIFRRYFTQALACWQWKELTYRLGKFQGCRRIKSSITLKEPSPGIPTRREFTCWVQRGGL